MFLALSFLGIGSLATAAVGWIPFIGQATAGAITGAGIVLGIAFNFCLTVTFGAAMIIFLAYNKLFDFRTFVIGGGELIPIINNAPLWTGLVIASIIAAERKRKTVATTTEEDLATDEEHEIEEQAAPEEAPALYEEVAQRQPVDGIRAPQSIPRAANDNRLNQKLVA